MDNKTYYDIEEMKNKDLNDVFVLINPDYDGKSLTEVIDSILHSDGLKEVTKVNAFIEKYNDDLLDLHEEKEKVEQEYEEKLQEAIVEQGKINQEKMKYGIRYNEYKHYQNQISTFEQDRIKETKERLFEIDKELTMLNKRIELLGEIASNRMLRRKEELEQEKSLLSKKNIDIDDSKKEAYYLAKQLEKKEQEAQVKKTQIIQEKSIKKTEIFQQIGELRDKKDKFVYLTDTILETFIQKYSTVNFEYDSVKEKFENAVSNKENKTPEELESIVELAVLYKEKTVAKNQMDKTYELLLKSLSDVVGLDIDETTMENSMEETFVETEEPTVEVIEEPEVEPIEEVEPEIEEPENVEEPINEEPINEEAVNEPEEDINEPIELENDDYSKMIAGNKAYYKKIDERCHQLSETFSSISQKPRSYFDELTQLDQLENIIALSTQNIEDKSIDKSSIIRTSDDIYITMELIDNYNDVMEKLEEIQQINDTWIGQTIINSEPDKDIEKTDMESTDEENLNEPLTEEATEESVEEAEPEIEGTVEEPVIEETSETTEEPEVSDEDFEAESPTMEIPKVSSEEMSNPFKLNDDEYIDNLDDESQYGGEEQSDGWVPEVEEPEEVDYGFVPNPMSEVIEPQSEEPVGLDEVMPEPEEVESTEEPEINQPTTEENIEEPEVEEEDDEDFVIESLSNSSEENSSNFEDQDELDESEYPTSKIADKPISIPEQSNEKPAEEVQKHTGGLLKKLMGKKEKKKSENEIKNIEDAPESILKKASDALHKRYLDEEGYLAWKENEESKQRGM